MRAPAPAPRPSQKQPTDNSAMQDPVAWQTKPLVGVRVSTPTSYPGVLCAHVAEDPVRFASVLTVRREKVLHGVAERANALLKETFAALQRVSLCPWRIGAIAKAALVLLHLERNRPLPSRHTS